MQSTIALWDHRKLARGKIFYSFLLNILSSFLCDWTVFDSVCSQAQFVWHHQHPLTFHRDDCVRGWVCLYARSERWKLTPCLVSAFLLSCNNHKSTSLKASLNEEHTLQSAQGCTLSERWEKHAFLFSGLVVKDMDGKWKKLWGPIQHFVPGAILYHRKM